MSEYFISEIKKKMLEIYLGPFLSRPSEEVRSFFRDVNVLGRYIVEAKDFNEIVTFLLVKKGRQNYRILTSSQVIEIFLGKDEEAVSYRDIIDPVVVVLVIKGEMENKRRWELIYQLAVERIFKNHGLIVLTQVKPSNLEDFTSLGFTFLDFRYIKNHKISGDF